MISHIKQLIWKNVEDQVPGAKLASTYTKEILDDYIHDTNLRKKNNASYNVSTSGLPAFTGFLSKSPVERRDMMHGTERNQPKLTMMRS